MELLFEIGCEELPAAAGPFALQELSKLFQEALAAQHIPVQRVYTYGTPRRLVLVAEGLPERQPDRSEVLLGPSVKAAFDAEGQPTRAALGFAKGHGVEVSALTRLQNAKGEYLAYEKSIQGRETRGLLGEILTELLRKIPFKKTMRWGATRERFARPIQWLCAILGGERVPVSFAEEGSAERVESGVVSYGHRFHAPTSFPIKNAADHIDQLRSSMVLADVAERREAIRLGLEGVADELGGALIPDEALLDEVTWLVEFPVPVAGSFEEHFLEIPREVLITSMRQHQRFFALEDPETQKLLPMFLTVAGTIVRDFGVVRVGNERVLRARLSDAAFFFREDQKKSLAAHGEGLSQVTFQYKLGSYAKKVERLGQLVPHVAAVLAPSDEASLQSALRAASLCKADLLTGMVGEFPEVQGVMGREYALRQGEPREVAVAIAEQYLPRGESDGLPETAAGAILALADRLDSVVGLFAVGERPSGVKDAFALRRSAMGILRIVLGREVSVDLRALINASLASLRAQGVAIVKEAELVGEVQEFFRGRLRGLLEKEGLRSDVLNAVFDAGYEDPIAVRERARALHQFTKHEQFESFCDLAKRIRKISLGEAQSAREVLAGGGFVYPARQEVQAGLFETEAEKSLFAAYGTAQEVVAGYLSQRNYTASVEALLALIGPVDEFMNRGPMVLCDDKILRNNRVALCVSLDALLSSLVSFEKVEARRELS